ncbi:TATA-box-binding protein [Salinibaculum rarum]|uniref:TATA-box-binding protein n=1 Tax=Salinibaculum rarum TaxID=3058903 RepID=UPI003A97E71A
MNDVTVENVVTSTSAGAELDLDALNNDLPQSEYNREQFPGLIYRSQDPKATTLIFRSGKIVCTGAKSLKDAKKALNQLFNQFDSLGLEYDEPEITVQNIVSSADLDKRLNLNAIAIGLGLESVEYEPEQFPGLVYRLDEPDVVTLLFGSGKLVITGASSRSEAKTALDELRTHLDEYGLV